MEAKRWTLGVVLAAAVSLFGLIQADASPFATYILSDDLGNQVNGTAPEQGDWEDGSDEGSGNVGDGGSGSGDDGGGNGADGSGTGASGDASGTGEAASGGLENDGHGNNEDGVDSSNKGQGQGGPNGSVDESCDGTGECVDDESKGGGAAPSKTK